MRASVAVAHGLGCPGPYTESSQTGDGTSDPCIGRWTLNHWATRKSPESFIAIEVESKWALPTNGIISPPDSGKVPVSLLL